MSRRGKSRGYKKRKRAKKQQKPKPYIATTRQNHEVRYKKPKVSIEDVALEVFGDKRVWKVPDETLSNHN